MLTAAQHRAREGKITASFVPALVAGDDEAISAKYRELIGDPSYTPENIDDVWAVHLGSFIEPLALDWHQRRTKQDLTRRGEVVVHPDRPFLSCTLDAYRNADKTCLDCKWCGRFRNIDEAISFYTPQMAVQRACTGADHAALLVVHGGGEPQEIAIHLTDEYEATILATIEAFWRCVETMTPPVDMPKPPPPPEKWRKIDLDRDADLHNWSADMIGALETWMSNAASAERYESAKKDVKALLPDDCSELRFDHVRVVRSRNRAVTIRFKP